MTVECVDSAGEATESGFGEVWGDDLAPSTWNGREVELVATLMAHRHLHLLQISQFYLQALQQKEKVGNVQIRSRLCEPLDLSPKARQEAPVSFPPRTPFIHALHCPSKREFSFAGPSLETLEALKCRNIVKTAWKKTKRVVKETGKGLEKVGKEAKKVVDKTIDFVTDHKKEVITVAVVVAAVVVGCYLAPVVAGALAGAADAANKKREDEDEGVPESPETLPPPTDIPPGETTTLLASAAPDGIAQLDSASTLKSPFNTFLEMQQQESLNRKPIPPSISAIPPHLANPCHVETEGVKRPGIGIGFIPGMNTSFEETMSHLNHLKKFAGDLVIEGVYNHSNGAFIDGLEIFILNYNGIAPVTEGLLLEKWAKFHEENINNPHAKYLQFTHSMGTILAKDALQVAPQEIRDRVMIVAIGPAAIIPDGLCFDAQHYASDKDVVYLGEELHLFWATGIGTHPLEAETIQVELQQELLKNREKLIILPSQPDATGIMHDFENPIFLDAIDLHISNYLNKYGESK